MGTRSTSVPMKTWRKIRAFRKSEESIPLILSLQALLSLSHSSVFNAPDGDVIALDPGMRTSREMRREWRRISVLYEQEGKAGARSTVDLNICFPSLLYMVHEVGFFFFYAHPSKNVEMQMSGTWPFPLLEKKMMGDDCPIVFSNSLLSLSPTLVTTILLPVSKNLST